MAGRARHVPAMDIRGSVPTIRERQWVNVTPKRRSITQAVGEHNGVQVLT